MKMMSVLDRHDLAHLMIAKYDRALLAIDRRAEPERYARVQARRDQVQQSLLTRLGNTYHG